jgi:hypothetical protein
MFALNYTKKEFGKYREHFKRNIVKFKKNLYEHTYIFFFFKKKKIGMMQKQLM